MSNIKMLNPSLRVLVLTTTISMLVACGSEQNPPENCTRSTVVQVVDIQSLKFGSLFYVPDEWENPYSFVDYPTQHYYSAAQVLLSYQGPDVAIHKHNKIADSVLDYFLPSARASCSPTNLLSDVDISDISIISDTTVDNIGPAGTELNKYFSIIELERFDQNETGKINIDLSIPIPEYLSISRTMPLSFLLITPRELFPNSDQTLTLSLVFENEQKMLVRSFFARFNIF